MKFSIIVPVYNEESTLRPMFDSLVSAGAGFNYEVIFVDDGSVDASHEIIKGFHVNASNINLISLGTNKGKTAAIKAGMRAARGDYIAIQDADLEYSPNDLFSIFAKLSLNPVPVIYGSRILGQNDTAYPLYYFGSQLITNFFNLLFSYKVTDLTTCYKVFKSGLVGDSDITSTRFGFCPDITCLLARKKTAILEVPISYSPRSFLAGKKIRMRDGIYFIWIILKNYFFHLISR